MDCKYYGIDVSKETLDIACDGKVRQIENKASAIKAFVKGMPKNSVVAMEATNTYHLLMADRCHAVGMKVYVVNPRITRHYREVRGYRGHNDRMDAKALSLYISKEYDGLREYMPKSNDQVRLQTLIRRRSKLVGVKGQLQQSMQDLKDVKREIQAVIKRLDSLVAQIDVLIDKQLEGNEDRVRIDGIVGVGPVVSAALVCELEYGKFKKADSYVAFIGYDTKPDDSGKRKGRRKISKQGSRLSRALLYNAAMSAVTSKVWKPIYERYLERGLTKIQSLVIIARKIAKIAWSIFTYKTIFDPARIGGKP